ncbi:MAG: 2-oxoacid:acceptor oxidoreductase subunit alpha [Dehalococcoidia bacterium]|uniref:2-oxoacid:acceptor oxidoreductase subunit alpha n=1 Tax=Candidatus Amarobacter glycogenicus TaxID=3140699 RepID=UPI001DA9CEE7|nr:2-oxoacid:acceptor oxidoreductase subunit alpha [Dehalococcoidia bacterium]MBK7725119.1 2-oxoacid:acceptor oxidoreductase subunit alpha [Dehalococcoidia bacterium]MBK9343670.1 2-oxoacid:acceptor oxidoreductase subunit alpha [Dehalococcoidia bacterium]
MTTETQIKPEHIVEELDRVTIRFAGDSGDGMQLTGTQFTKTAAVFGNDLATLPDFPAEIRAPTGSLPGVSGFQLSFSGSDIHTPGDRPDVLVAMNPAALKTNIGDLRPGGLLIVDENEFEPTNLKKAAYVSNPLEDGSLSAYQLVPIDITRQNELALEGLPLNAKDKFRSRNFYALGLILWLYGRSMDTTVKWATEQFSRRPDILDANLRALKSGYNFGETTELFRVQYRVPPAVVPAGTYRHISGNEATALGCVAASVLSGLPLFYGSYPITPASDILHELSKLKAFGVKTFQAEDEIAAIGAAIGAAYGGHLALTGTSGPGLALKSEALNLAVMTELPLVVIDVQRAGPSTGMPTKTEQSDLLQAMFGRNGDSYVAILAPATPSDCFLMAIEAFRIALKYMVPVILLSDGYVGNGSEPWRIPDVSALPKIPWSYAKEGEEYSPYSRDPKTLARSWAVPGQKGLEHRIGGLEKSGQTGDISYDPRNHHEMTLARKGRVDRIASDIPDLEVQGPSTGDILVLGWGGTYGAITSAAENARKNGLSVASAHLRYLNPFPGNLEKVLRSYKHVLIPELNTGQLSLLVRGRFVIDAVPFNKISGQPFKIAEIEGKIDEVLGRSGPYVFEFPQSSGLSGG